MNKQERHYNFHGILSMKIIRPAITPFGGMIDRVYAAYETKEKINPQLIIHIGSFEPDLEGAFQVGKFYVGPDTIFAHMKYKGARWSVYVAALKQGDFSVKVSLNPLGAIGFSSTTLVNLVKMAFGLRGYASIHGACFGLGDKAVLFPARSGVGKTLMSLHMLKMGFRLLGDDKVFVRDGRVYNHLLPINLKFTYEKLPEVKITPAQKISLLGKKWLSQITGGFLNLLTPVSIRQIFPGKVIDEAHLAGVRHMISSENYLETTPPELDSFVRQMIINSQMEAGELCQWISAHAFVYPEGPMASYWEDQALIMKKTFLNANLGEIHVPRVFTDQVAASLEGSARSLIEEAQP